MANETTNQTPINGKINIIIKLKKKGGINVPCSNGYHAIWPGPVE